MTLITEEQYREASAAQEAAQKIINKYLEQKRESFKRRLVDNPVFLEDELTYSATALCPCGHGLAYPKGCGAGHYWDCSAILRGVDDTSVQHCDKYPFAFYEIKSESEHRGTTRGVFRPQIPKVQP